MRGTPGALQPAVTLGAVVRARRNNNSTSRTMNTSEWVARCDFRRIGGFTKILTFRELCLIISGEGGDSAIDTSAGDRDVSAVLIGYGRT